MLFLLSPAKTLDYDTPVPKPVLRRATEPLFADRAAQLITVLRRHSASQVAALMEGLSLTEHQHKPMYMLSTGSRRKVWFAAAAVCGAPLTLVDEPFAALDKRSIAFVCEVLRAAGQRQDRVWILADHEAPEGVPLAGIDRAQVERALATDLAPQDDIRSTADYRRSVAVNLVMAALAQAMAR